MRPSQPSNRGNLSSLVNECLPGKLKNSFASHECSSVPEEMLSDKKNGELLPIAQREGFQIFLAMNKGIEYEQNLAGRLIAVMLLHQSASYAS